MKRTSFVLSGTLVMLCVFVTSLTACGIKNEPTTTSGNSQSAASSAVEKKIVFWNLYYNTQNESDKNLSKDDLFVNKTAREFEKANPGLTVEVSSPPMDNYFNMLKAACVANNGPDVVMNWVGGPLLDYQQYMLPLDKYYTKEEMAQLTGWSMVRKDLKADGDIMAVPIGMNGGVFVFYTNKALFQKAGVDVNSAPKTWDEFLALCDSLKKGGVTPFITGDKEGWNTAWVIGQLWWDLSGYDGILAVRNGQQKFAENKEYKQAFTTWKKLFDLGYTNKDVVSLAQADGQAKFLAGEGAMEVGWSNIAKDVYTGLGEDAGWFPIPHINADAPYANTFYGGYAGYCFSVTNFSKVPEESIKYIKYMTSKDVMDRFVDETQFDLSNNVNAKVPDFKTNPIMAWMYNYIKTTTQKPAISWDSILQGDLCQEMYNMSGAMFGGKMTLEEGLGKFDSKYAAITKK